jgi:hypothetical protein
MCSLWIPLGNQSMNSNTEYSAGLSIFNLYSPIPTAANMSSISGHLLQDPSLKVSHLYHSSRAESLHSLSYDDYDLKSPASSDSVRSGIGYCSVSLDSKEYSQTLDVSSDGSRMTFRSASPIQFQNQLLRDFSSHLITNTFTATAIQNESEHFKGIVRSQTQRDILKLLHAQGYSAFELDEMLEAVMALSDKYSSFLARE